MRQTELLFTIKGKHYWEEVRDTVNRITAEYSGKNYALRIDVESVPCYADTPVEINYPENGKNPAESR